MDNLEPPRDPLEEKLRHAEKEFLAKYESTAESWLIPFGLGGVRTSISSVGITRISVAFNMVCFAAGAVFIFMNGIFRTLGISLVVGSLFSAGAFFGQWWNSAIQRERTTADRAFNFSDDDWRYKELRQLGKAYVELYELCKQLAWKPPDSATGGDDTTAKPEGKRARNVHRRFSIQFRHRPLS